MRPCVLPGARVSPQSQPSPAATPGGGRARGFPVRAARAPPCPQSSRRRRLSWRDLHLPRAAPQRGPSTTLGLHDGLSLVTLPLQETVRRTTRQNGERKDTSGSKHGSAERPHPLPRGTAAASLAVPFNTRGQVQGPRKVRPPPVRTALPPVLAVHARTPSGQRSDSDRVWVSPWAFLRGRRTQVPRTGKPRVWLQKRRSSWSPRPGREPGGSRVRASVCSTLARQREGRARGGCRCWHRDHACPAPCWLSPQTCGRPSGWKRGGGRASPEALPMTL